MLILLRHRQRTSQDLSRSGGTNNNFVSEFDGPLVLNKKVTSTSDEGMDIKVSSSKVTLLSPENTLFV